MGLSRRALLTLDFERPPEAIERLMRVRRIAMACGVEMALPEEAAGQVPAARAALDEADRIEALLSVFRASSELTRINQEGAAGAGGVDPEVIALLERTRVIH